MTPTKTESIQAVGESSNELGIRGSTGQEALRRARNIMAIGTAVLSIGPGLPETLADQPIKPTVPNVSFVVKPLLNSLVGELPSHSTHNQTRKGRCTLIRIYPNAESDGEACQNNLLIRLHKSPSHQYDYGIIYVNGVYKCGWVKAGVIPTRQPSSKTTDCQVAYTTLSNPNTILKNINCQHCTDGRPTKLTLICDHMFYKNFATKDRSVLNLHPNGKSGFSDYIGKQYGVIKYRAKINKASGAGEAIIARSRQFGWGVMNSNCVTPGAHLGGPGSHA